MATVCGCYLTLPVKYAPCPAPLFLRLCVTNPHY
jgi:hypothetical protein